MTPKKCMYIAKSLTNTQHMELEPLCSALNGETIQSFELLKSQVLLVSPDTKYQIR